MRTVTYRCNCGRVKICDDFLYPVTCCNCERKYLKVDGKVLCLSSPYAKYGLFCGNQNYGRIKNE